MVVGPLPVDIFELVFEDEDLLFEIGKEMSIFGHGWLRKFVLFSLLIFYYENYIRVNKSLFN